MMGWWHRRLSLVTFAPLCNLSATPIRITMRPRIESRSSLSLSLSLLCKYSRLVSKLFPKGWLPITQPNFSIFKNRTISVLKFKISYNKLPKINLSKNQTKKAPTSISEPKDSHLPYNSLIRKILVSNQHNIILTYIYFTFFLLILYDFPI